MWSGFGGVKRMDPGIRSIVLSRLQADEQVDQDWSALVFAALEGSDALERELSGDVAVPGAAPMPAHPMPAGAYLQSIAVQGFRGIGPAQTMELRPGPGLTLVVGRNGSGKSSFAEALEVLLTGDSMRWKERAAVWREGWRNLHQPSVSLTATFLVEGECGPCAVWRRWEPGTAFETAEAAAQFHGKPPSDLASLGWAAALRTHRPFLSYNELGSLLDEGPAKLYDALSSILGLEDLVVAQRALMEARRFREKALKDAMDARNRMLDRLRDVDDPRARRVLAALDGEEWDLTAVEDVLAGAVSGGVETEELDVLRGLASLEAPEPARVAAAISEMRGAAAALQSAQRTAAARSREVAALIELALRYHESHGDGDCPVCGRKGALDRAWSTRQRTSAANLREAAREADAVHARAKAAGRLWEGLAVLKGDALTGAARIGMKLDDLVEALGAWVKAGSITDLGQLADHVESASGPLRDAIVRLRENALAQLGRMEDTWRPVSVEVATWLPGARHAMQGAGDIKRLKSAEAWLKKAAAGIRDDRFAPIAEKAAGIWELLRQQSHVELGRIQLRGEGTRRRVALDITVDGVEGAALAVMSQGELNSLALSLFVPRATLRESPFRFVIIDDPVQSMDPARVDGLARVLETAAATHQVLVFTHDDRLPEAVRRLDIAAEIIEVTRREASVVELRRALDPVGRYIEDAFAVASTGDLPSSAATRVVPGLCCLALEAACMEVVRRRRLARGEPHADVERILREAAHLPRLAALAVFDDVERVGEVPPRLDHDIGPGEAETFRLCHEGALDIHEAAAVDLVRRASKIAAWIQGQR
jgi:energy-coupling factor transporter ATP-binding protein EcfA2